MNHSTNMNNFSDDNHVIITADLGLWHQCHSKTTWRTHELTSRIRPLAQGGREMTQYEMAVYITKDLHDYASNYYSDGYLPQKIAEDYINGAFSRISGHSVSVLTPSERPTPGSEKWGESFSAPCPCDPFYYCNYSGPLDYFREWLTCKNVPVAQDSNIMISSTGNTGGGATNANGGRYCFAQTGQIICDLGRGYTNYGYSGGHDGMHTILHELGHSLFDGDNMSFPAEDDDGDGNDWHDFGAVHYHPYGDTITPMYIQGSKNNCNYSYDTSYISGEEMVWSDCSIQHWK